MSLEMLSRSPRSKANSILVGWAVRALDTIDRGLEASSLPDLCGEAIEIVKSKEYLQSSWDCLAKYNGQGTGPNGLTFSDFSRVSKLNEIDRLHDELSNGTYRHGDVRVVVVPKRPGSFGTRTLSLPNIQDRVVVHAIAQVLEPLFRHRFDARSFCRFTMGSWHALAEAKRLAEKERRWTWITEDIQDAFGSVPLDRLFEILATYLPSEPLLDLLRRAVGDHREQGLFQGSPLSPLLMNILLDAVIDRPWRELHPDVPLLRYMDDIAILCRGGDNVERFYADLEKLVVREALHLKHGFKNAVKTLQKRSPTWLGYSLSRKRDALAVQLPFQKSIATTAQWKKYLHERFIESHHKADARLAAVQRINGILYWAGPALPWSNPQPTYELLRAAARAAGIEEIQSFATAHRVWRDSYDRWQQFYEMSLAQPAPAQSVSRLNDFDPDSDVF